MALCSVPNPSSIPGQVRSRKTASTTYASTVPWTQYRVRPLAAQRRVAPTLKLAARPCRFRTHELRHVPEEPARLPCMRRVARRSPAHGLGSVASPNWRPLPTRERGRRRVLQNPAATRHGHFPRTPMPRQQDTGSGAWRGIGLPIHWNPARASTGCPMSDDETGQFHW